MRQSGGLFVLFSFQMHCPINPRLLEEFMVSAELKMNFQKTPQLFEGI